jgi:3-hydroxyisobutyrate dehydrogenase-like beta-hydroxyacid dehydrogenase
MAVTAVGILSPGDMGAAIGAVLGAHGVPVLTCLAGRSDLTHLRAREAGMRGLPDLDALVREAGLILSVLVPAEAEGLALQLAEALRRTGARPVFADCNAISPGTMRHIAGAVAAAGATVIDAGIIGPPPGPGRGTRIYCSGPDVAALMALNEYGLDVRVVGDAIGQASGLKMVYAASTKGTTALWTELLVAARALGLDQALAAEFAQSRGGIAAQVSGSIPSMPRRARRWVGEMEEIARTFAEVGLTPLMLEGAAAIYRLVSETPLADQTSREPDPPLATVIDTLAEQAARRNRAPAVKAT